MLALLCVFAAQETLLHETFEDGAFAPGAWDARIDLVTKRHIDPTMHGPTLFRYVVQPPERGRCWAASARVPVANPSP